MARFAVRFLTTAVLWLLAVRAASAHPISVTNAFVYVTQEEVTAKIDVFVEDLFLFHNLQPNDQDFLEPATVLEGVEKHKAFLLERFLIRDFAGRDLAGRVLQVSKLQMEPEGIRMGDLMAYRLTYELEYSLRESPEFLTFSQHLVDEQLLVPAEMQLQVKQESAGTDYQEMLYPDQPVTIRFSWDNPPLSPDDSQQAWDEWYERQKEETLGITSYSSVYSFLYIEDREVRHEILVPLLTLEDSVLISRADNNFLEVAEQDAAREQIAAYFTAGNPVQIDGHPIAPVVQRVDFYGLDFKDFARRAERRRVSMANARVGVILAYPTRQSPKSVQVTWDRFNQYVWSVTMTVFAYDDTSQVILARAGSEDSYRWTDPGRELPPPREAVAVRMATRPHWSVSLPSLGCLALVPAVFWIMKRRAVCTSNYGFALAIFCCCAAAMWPFGRREIPDLFAAGPRVTENQAGSIVPALVENVYRAFDYRDEDQVYETLELSVDGPLLEDLYLQVRRSLEMQEQGGAVSRVRKIEPVEGQLVESAKISSSDERAFGYDFCWTVTGTVEHWGHVHQRTNEYHAQITIEPRSEVEAGDEFWKITSMEVLDERRVEFETKLRGA